MVGAAWDGVCGGGVDWCPVSGAQVPYKNAITTELYFTGAMLLHPHAAVLGKAPGYYLDWAARMWGWFGASGLVNAAGLVNDGLDGATCRNNGQTTWTYNQGVLLEGLALLGAATGNASLVALAGSIAGAVAAGAGGLSPGGILEEPCGGPCSGDQLIFKGIYVRHLARLAALAPGAAPPSGAAAAPKQTTLLGMMRKAT